jgi:beta-lactamase regulating signal transducer with metallopeptidase domain
MLPVILEAAIRSMVLAGAVWLGLKALRITNPHILMAAWQMVLVASLFMPLLACWAAFPVSPTVLPLRQMLSIESANFFATPAAQVLSQAPPAPPALPVRPPTVDWRLACSAIYVAIAAFLMLRLLVGSALTWRLCRSASPVQEDWAAGRDVRTSACIYVPVTFGATILLPETYARWDGTERRAVMAHEQAHVSNGDFYVLLLAAINRAVFWFSPLAWWLNSRIAYLAEARSDAAAIQDIEDRVRYAEILLGFGTNSSRATMSLAMAGTATVRPRVEHILAETMLPRKPGWQAWPMIAACIVPLVAITAGVRAQMPPPTQQTAISTPNPAALRDRQAEQKLPRREVPIDPNILDNYVGYYQLGAYKIFTVTRQGDRLFVQLTGQELLQVYPESPQKFFYTAMPAQISFITDPQGRATGLVLHQNGLENPAMRVDQAQAQSIENSFTTRRKDDTPLPGTEVALRRQIEAFQQDKPDLDAMTDGLAEIYRPQVSKIERSLALLGPLQTVSFRGVGF